VAVFALPGEGGSAAMWECATETKTRSGERQIKIYLHATGVREFSEFPPCCLYINHSTTRSIFFTRDASVAPSIEARRRSSQAKVRYKPEAWQPLAGGQRSATAGISRGITPASRRDASRDGARNAAKRMQQRTLPHTVGAHALACVRDENMLIPSNTTWWVSIKLRV